MKSGPYQIQFRGKGPCHWWRVVSTRNGQIILTSEIYPHRSSARRSAKRFAAATALPMQP